MAIVCGTDFSDNAVLAARAAGAIAMRLAVSLKLVHVMDEREAARCGGELHDAVDDPRRARLRTQAEELRARGRGRTARRARRQRGSATARRRGARRVAATALAARQRGRARGV